MTIPTSWRPYLLPVLLTVGIRGLWMLVVFLCDSETGHFMFDSDMYWHFGNTIVEHGKMAYTNGTEFYPVHSHTPLYPFLMAFFIWSGIGFKGLVVLQIICTGVTALFLIKTGELLFENRRVGVIAAILLAIDIPSIVFSNMLMTETIYTMLFAISLFGFVKYMKGKASWKMMLLAGFVLGLAVLCRAVGLFLPALFLLWIALRRKSTPKPLLAGGILIIGLMLPLGTWMIRNYVVFDRVFVTTLGNTNLFFYRAAGIFAEEEGKTLFKARRELEAQHPPMYPVDHPGELVDHSRQLADEGMRIIWQHKGTYAKIHTYAAFKLLFQPMRQPLEMQFGYRNEAQAISGWTHDMKGNIVSRLFATTSTPTMILVLFQFIYLGVIWFLWLRGSWKLYRRKQWFPIFISTGIILYYCAVAAGPETDARFRVALIPFVLLVSAYGFVKGENSKEKKKSS